MGATAAASLEASFLGGRLGKLTEKGEAGAQLKGWLPATKPSGRPFSAS
jgi:hypothetical protein